MGRNRRDVAERLHETLAGAGVPLLGVVANGLKAGLASYGYTNAYPQAKVAPTPLAEPLANGPLAEAASVNGASVNGASANGASAEGAPPSESEEPIPTEPAYPMAPTYGEAVDLLGRLGDLTVESPTDESPRPSRRRRASRRT
jgi:hypothetical protein